MKQLLLYIALLFCAASLYAQQSTILRFNDEHIIHHYDLAAGTLTSADKKQVEQEYNTTRYTAQQMAAGITGEVTFSYNGSMYDAYIVDQNTQQIQMHWQMPYGNAFKTLNNVKHQLASQGKEALMITNGGMYLENNVPQGLLIINGTQLRQLNTRNSSYGNFYMKPNGVFCIDDNGAHVYTTPDFQAKSKKGKYNYTTQSGPMLLIDGKIHPKFKHGSTNLHLRSGVGIMPNGKVVFIISRGFETNFHDFAVIFKDVFGCDDALYLDGAISRMYLPKLRPKDTGGDFGTIISVTHR